MLSKVFCLICWISCLFRNFYTMVSMCCAKVLLLRRWRQCLLTPAFSRHICLWDTVHLHRPHRNEQEKKKRRRKRPILLFKPDGKQFKRRKKLAAQGGKPKKSLPPFMIYCAVCFRLVLGCQRRVCLLLMPPCGSWSACARVAKRSRVSTAHFDPAHINQTSRGRRVDTHTLHSTQGPTFRPVHVTDNRPYACALARYSTRAYQEQRPLVAAEFF